MVHVVAAPPAPKFDFMRATHLTQPKTAKILRRKLIDDHAIVLCHWPHGGHEYVVWRVGPDGEAYWGEYCSDEAEGNKKFDARK